ncbi:group II truncated hemoglobin [Cochlodiniinecator piscidefendens]|uniref:group II truncated hemoglobin n=1 Tax=Cochlodiniinecator piscidefendens TaxID=2715756 RepID=UPI0014084643|nr:group II truncated hemoglobin [Cochlodiniinecator piscidefendens]
MEQTAHTLLDRIGGEVAVKRLVETFYDLMESDPEVYELHRLHFRGHGLNLTRSEQFNFLTGFFGGRRYYIEKHGHMNLRQIHEHIPIRSADVEMWLELMDRALEQCDMRGPDIEKIRATLRRAALTLINDLPDWRTGDETTP